MTVTLKYRILDLLSKDTDALFSISDIAKKLGVAYSHAHFFIAKLMEEDVIKVQKIGNVSVCRLNLKQPLTLSYLSVIESRRALDWIRKNPHSDKIITHIGSVKDECHSVLIKNKHIIVIAPHRSDSFKMFRNRSVIAPDELRRRRKQFSDCIILHGAEKYWSLLSG